MTCETTLSFCIYRQLSAFLSCSDLPCSTLNSTLLKKIFLFYFIAPIIVILYLQPMYYHATNLRYALLNEHDLQRDAIWIEAGWTSSSNPKPALILLSSNASQHGWPRCTYKDNQSKYRFIFSLEMSQKPSKHPFTLHHNFFLISLLSILVFVFVSID